MTPDEAKVRPSRMQGWAVVTSRGHICDWTCSWRRKYAIREYLATYANSSKPESKSWAHHYNRGYRCVKVTRVIEGRKP